MSRLGPDQSVMPSLFDRLTDPDTGGTGGRVGYTTEQMFRAVRHDLEQLLNTRQSHADMPADFPELRRSVLGYGLPDLVSLNALSPNQTEEIGLVVQEIISVFEPRLRDVRVHLVPSDTRNLTLRFHVDARLCLEPAPEVAFDTILELTTGRYAVKESGGKP